MNLRSKINREKFIANLPKNISSIERVAAGDLVPINVNVAENDTTPMYMWDLVMPDGTAKVLWYSEDKHPLLPRNCSNLFGERDKLSDISGLKDLDASEVLNMDSMFGSCISLENVSSAANWDVSHVTNMDDMFRETKITTLTALKNWNVKMKNMEQNY